MALKLTIDIPDDLAATLAERAAAANTTPEAVAAAYAVDHLRMPADYVRFRQRWAGKLDTDVPDASVRTDEYLADEYLDPHEPKPNAP
ncbi:MAG: hypothetical protein K2X87_16080 [Gemmataceae bacterium]|nr:hypothetical protein [Gemmataceae bacterium]